MHTFFDKIPDFIKKLSENVGFEHLQSRGHSLFYPKDEKISQGLDFIKSRNQLETCQLVYRTPCISILFLSDRYLIEFSDRIALAPDWDSNGFYGFKIYAQSDAYRCLYVFIDGNVMFARRDGKGKYPASLAHFSKAVIDATYEFLEKRDFFWESIFRALIECDDSFLFKDLKKDFDLESKDLLAHTLNNKDITLKDLFLESNRSGKTALYKNIYGDNYTKYHSVCPIAVVGKINTMNAYLRKNKYNVDFSQMILDFAGKFYPKNTPKKKYFLSGERFVSTILGKFRYEEKKNEALEYLLSLYLVLRCLKGRKEISDAIKSVRGKYAEIFDYVRFCIEHKEKIHLKKTSIESLINEHRAQIARAYSDLNSLNATGRRLLKKNSVFYKLEPLEGMSLLETDQALAIEGQIQHNCVFSYAKYVEAGKGAIYSLIYEDAQYTVEISLLDGNKLELAQMRGKYNTLPEQKVIDYVSQWLKKQNALIRKISNI